MPKYIPPGMAELSVYIDRQLKMDFKLVCVAQNKSMSEIVGEIVKQWVNSQSQNQSSLNDDGKGVA